MISYYAVVTLLIMHWLFDFVCQSDEMVINKSTSLKWLSIHVGVYSIGLFIFAFFFLSPLDALSWAIFNAFLHFCVDDNTSKLGAYFWKKDMRRWFFVTVGFDQLFHYFCLFTTYLIWSTL